MCIRKAERGGRESIWMSVSHTGHILDFKRQDENEKDTLTLSDENRAEMETSAKALSLPVSEPQGPVLPTGMEGKELGATLEAKCQSMPLHRLPARPQRERKESWAHRTRT